MWGANPMLNVDGKPASDPTPGQVGSDNNWKSVANGRGYALALKEDGSLYKGEITPNPWGATNTPSRLGNDSRWVAIDASRADHFLALKSDGSLWAWGDNFYNPLGGDEVPSSDSPVRVGSDSDWVDISTHWNRNYAIKSDGTMHYWGKDTSVPRKKGTDADWATVSVGADHYMALKKDGSLWAWGLDMNGILGTGGPTTSTPRQIDSDNDWASVSAGHNHTVALKKDGSLWAWGANSYGQLGIGNFSNASTPTRIDSDNDWAVISSGMYFTTATKTDGSLWAWGKNEAGQVNASGTNRNTPVKIGEGFVATSPSPTHPTSINLAHIYELLLDEAEVSGTPQLVNYEEMQISGLGPFALFEATNTPGLDNEEAFTEFARNFYYSILMNLHGDVVLPGITGLPASILQGWGLIPTFTLLCRGEASYVLPVILVRPHNNSLMNDWGHIRLEINDGSALLSNEVELETTRTNFGFLNSSKLYAFVPKAAYVAVKSETVTPTTDFNYGVKVVLPNGTTDKITFEINLDGIVRDWAVLNDSWSANFTGSN